MATEPVFAEGDKVVTEIPWHREMTVLAVSDWDDPPKYRCGYKDNGGDHWDWYDAPQLALSTLQPKKAPNAQG